MVAGMDSRGGSRGSSVAFFLIKSSVNFVAVAAIGTAMALGLGPGAIRLADSAAAGDRRSRW